MGAKLRGIPALLTAGTSANTPLLSGMDCLAEPHKMSTITGTSLAVLLDCGRQQLCDNSHVLDSAL